MSTKTLTIHLAYIIVICTLLGMLYMQRDFFESQANSSTEEQDEAQQKLAELTKKFDTLQTDFEALHQKKNPTEQSLYYQERFETLEVKHNALKVICEHHKSDLDNCLDKQPSETSQILNNTSESTHPIQLLNERLERQKQALVQELDEPTENEYEDPAQYASPETTKPEPQPELVEPAPIAPEPQPEPVEPAPIAPEPQPEPVQPTPIALEPQSKPVAPAPLEPASQPETIEPTKVDETSHHKTKLYQCPSADTINSHLATGNFTENNITWWLDFSFRPIHSNEEVKATYKTLFSGKFMDCYYQIGPKDSDDIVNGIWIVIKGTAKNHMFLPANNWKDCDIEGCTKMCEKEDDSACEFGLEAKN